MRVWRVNGSMRSGVISCFEHQAHNTQLSGAEGHLGWLGLGFYRTTGHFNKILARPSSLDECLTHAAVSATTTSAGVGADTIAVYASRDSDC